MNNEIESERKIENEKIEDGQIEDRQLQRRLISVRQTTMDALAKWISAQGPQPATRGRRRRKNGLMSFDEAIERLLRIVSKSTK